MSRSSRAQWTAPDPGSTLRLWRMRITGAAGEDLRLRPGLPLARRPRSEYARCRRDASGCDGPFGCAKSDPPLRFDPAAFLHPV
jgi:hypothetical protein